MKVDKSKLTASKLANEILDKLGYGGKKLSATASKSIGKIIARNPSAKGLADFSPEDIDKLEALVRGDFLTNPEGYDFRPPAKMNIVGCIGDISSDPLIIFCALIQSEVANLSHKDFKYIAENFSKRNKNSNHGLIGFLSDKNTKLRDRIRYIDDENGKDLGIQVNISDEWKNILVKEANNVINSTINVYNGVLKKAENKEKKDREKLERYCKRKGKPVPEIDPSAPHPALDKDGFLKNKPGFKPVLSSIQGNFGILDRKSLKKIKKDYPNTQDYETHELDDVLVPPTVEEICGKMPPEYREHYRRYLENQGKGIRRRLKRRHRSSTHPKYKEPKCEEERKYREFQRSPEFQEIINKPIFAWVKIGDLYFLLDIRGLLRNLKWRKLIKNKPTVREVFDFFSGDTQVRFDIEVSISKDLNVEIKLADGNSWKKWACTVLYRPGKVPVKSEKPMSKREVKNGETILAADVGVNKNVAAVICRVSEKGLELLEKIVLPEYYYEKLDKIKEFHDLEQDMLRQLALEQCSPRTQEEFAVEKSEELIIKKFEDKFGPSFFEGIDTDTINPHGQDLYSRIEELGHDTKDYEYLSKQKGSKNKTKHPYNNEKIAKEVCKVSQEAREEFNNKHFEALRGSDSYRRLSIKKREFVREVTNYLVKNYSFDYMAVEKLDGKDNKFSGKGSKMHGLLGLLARRNENRWVMNQMNQALQDSAPHKGVKVIVVPPYYTSQRCPECSYASPDNRNKHRADIFKCKNCGYSGDADLDVATYNIAWCAMMGRGIRKGDVLTEPNNKNKKDGENMKSSDIDSSTGGCEEYIF